jgi:hypothetical protein
VSTVAHLAFSCHFRSKIEVKCQHYYAKLSKVQELTNPTNSNYTALQLLDSGEGQATCLLCRKTYAADQLTRFAIGAGDSPFNVQIRPWGIRESLFGSKRRNFSMFGGKGFRCPAGHKLISAVTWIS